MPGHIYLIREREHIRMREHVYKLGKTEQEGLKRAGQYPKDSSIEIHLRVDDCHVAERELLAGFKREFKHRSDIGAEYFEGDRNRMILAICEYNQMVTTDDSQPPEQKVAPMELVDTQAAIDGLNGIFYQVFYNVQRFILNEYQEYSMRGVQTVHRIQKIYELGGKATLDGNDVGMSIDLDKFGADMKKLYSKPGPTKSVSSEQFHKYVGVQNTLSRLVETVTIYMTARGKMVTPDKYIGIKLKPTLAIDSATYTLGLKKCSDFGTRGHYYTHMPGC
jgi:hypothetical protein